jgi:hypothetical protein
VKNRSPQYFVLFNAKTLDYLFDNQAFVVLYPPQYFTPKTIQYQAISECLCFVYAPILLINGEGTSFVPHLNHFKN